MSLANMTTGDHMEYHGDETPVGPVGTADKPWAAIVLASFAINLATLSGVFISAISRCAAVKHRSIIEALYIPSFAAGALMATGAFLLIPESLEMLIHASEASEHGHDEHRLLEEEHHEEESHEGEAAFAWKFGAALLGGFLLPLLLHTLLPQAREIVEECEECQQEESAVILSPAARVLVEGDDNDMSTNKPPATDDKKEDVRTMESGCDAGDCDHCVSHGNGDDRVIQCNEGKSRLSSTTGHKQVNLPLTLSILLGDGIHNLTDGVFLANAFLLCSREIAWTMVATTVYHELAQELADYIVLTVHCGLPIWKALLLNFISGLSVLLGAVIILVVDLSEAATGSILAFGGGVYIYIAAVECVPRVLALTKGKRKLFVGFLAMFALGAVPIGLVLLNHGHCGSE